MSMKRSRGLHPFIYVNKAFLEPSSIFMSTYIPGSLFPLVMQRSAPKNLPIINLTKLHNSVILYTNSSYIRHDQAPYVNNLQSQVFNLPILARVQIKYIYVSTIIWISPFSNIAGVWKPRKSVFTGALAGLRQYSSVFSFLRSLFFEN